MTEIGAQSCRYTIVMREHCGPAALAKTGPTPFYPIPELLRLTVTSKNGLSAAKHNGDIRISTLLVLVLLVFAYFAGIHGIGRKGPTS